MNSNIKHLVFLLGLISILGIACKQSGSKFTIEGDLKELGIKELFFIRMSDSQKVDTVKVVDGKFTFQGQNSEPTVYMINLGPELQPAFAILEPGNFKVSYDKNSLQQLQITGGTEQASYNDFVKKCSPIFTKIDSLMKLGYAEDLSDIEKMSLQNEFESLDKQLQDKQRAFIKENKNKVVAAFMAKNLIDGMQEENGALVEEYYNTLSPEIQKSYFGRQIGQQLAVIKQTASGQQASDFTLPSIDGTPITLSSFKGKITLIDFWASWCGPCREENPFVVQAYNAFHAKGFEILGVSLDKDKTKWQEAISKDGLNWTHVSNLKGWDCEVAKQYGVESIPTNFLLDKDGKIIAKNLRGEELRIKLASLLP